MSTLEKLKNMNLPDETIVSLSLSEGTDVFHFNETHIETALDETDVVETLAELISTPKLNVEDNWGNNILQVLREQGLLEGYERDGTFEDYLAETINENYYDVEIVEDSTERYDHKRGFTTLSADVRVKLGDLTKHVFWLSGAWDVCVKTEAGSLTLD